MRVIVKQQQSVSDLALQYFGTTEAVFLVADRLGITVTDTPTPGAEFEYQLYDVIDPHVVNHYLRNGIIPTTAIDNSPQ